MENKKLCENELETLFEMLGLIFNTEKIMKQENQKNESVKADSKSQIVSDFNILGAKQVPEPVCNTLRARSMDNKIHTNTLSEEDKYQIVFRNRDIPSITISKKMYDNMIINGDFTKTLGGQNTDDLMHGIDGDERLSVRKSEILYINKSLI